VFARRGFGFFFQIIFGGWRRRSLPRRRFPPQPVAIPFDLRYPPVAHFFSNLVLRFPEIVFLRRPHSQPESAECVPSLPRAVPPDVRDSVRDPSPCPIFLFLYLSYSDLTVNVRTSPPFASPGSLRTPFDRTTYVSLLLVGLFLVSLLSPERMA